MWGFLHIISLNSLSLLLGHNMWLTISLHSYIVDTYICNQQSHTRSPHQFDMNTSHGPAQECLYYVPCLFSVADRLDRLWFLRDAMIVEEDFDKYYQTMFTERNVLGKHPSDVSKDGTVSLQPCPPPPKKKQLKKKIIVPMNISQHLVTCTYTYMWSIHF